MNIIVTSYLFYDACNSSSNLSKYGSLIKLNGNAGFSLSYDSNENAYKISNTGSAMGMIPITSLYGKDNFIIQADFRLPISNQNHWTGFGFATSTGNGFSPVYRYNYFDNIPYSNSSSSDSLSGLSLNSTSYYTLIIVKSGSSLTSKLYNGSSLILTTTRTVSSINSSSLNIGLAFGYTNGEYGYVKNIKCVSN